MIQIAFLKQQIDFYHSGCITSAYSTANYIKIFMNDQADNLKNTIICVDINTRVISSCKNILNLFFSWLSTRPESVQFIIIDNAEKLHFISFHQAFNNAADFNSSLILYKNQEYSASWSEQFFMNFNELWWHFLHYLLWNKRYFCISVNVL